MHKISYIFLADGFEEIEAITTIDVLRRAGLPIKSVSITPDLNVTGAHGVMLSADVLFSKTDFTSSEWLILPGGMPGATNLAAFKPLCQLLIDKNNNNEKIAAICASPAFVLAPNGILDGRNAICYPGFERNMHGATIGATPIVLDDNILTANGPASATQFGLAIVSCTLGEDAARDIAEGLLLYPQQHKFYF